MPCLGRGLIDGLSDAAAGLPAEFRVVGTECMSGCRRPCTAAFRAPGKATYMFGDIDPLADIPSLVAFARLYATSVDGQTRLVERPKPLRPKLLARIPAVAGPGG